MENIKNVHENTDHRPSNYISKDSLIPPLSNLGNDGMGLFLKEYLLMLVICFSFLVLIFLAIHFFKPKHKTFQKFKKL